METMNVWGCEEGGVAPMKATEVPRMACVSEKSYGVRKDNYH